MAGLTCILVIAVLLIETAKAQLGDVLVVTGGLHNIGRSLVKVLRTSSSPSEPQLSPPVTTVLVLDSAPLADAFQEAAFTSEGDNEWAADLRCVRADITVYEDLIAALLPYAGRLRGVIHLAAGAHLIAHSRSLLSVVLNHH